MTFFYIFDFMCYLTALMFNIVLIKGATSMTREVSCFSHSEVDPKGYRELRNKNGSQSLTEGLVELSSCSYEFLTHRTTLLVAY